MDAALYLLGTSANLRQHLIMGLERALEGSALGARVPKLAALGSAAMRVGNNVWGGEQFAQRWGRRVVDMTCRV
jgi:hypothetical protein